MRKCFDDCSFVQEWDRIRVSQKVSQQDIVKHSEEDFITAVADDVVQALYKLIRF